MVGKDWGEGHMGEKILLEEDIPIGKEENHVDTYMVLNTTGNKARTQYSKEVS